MFYIWDKSDIYVLIGPLKTVGALANHRAFMKRRQEHYHGGLKGLFEVVSFSTTRAAERFADTKCEGPPIPPMQDLYFIPDCETDDIIMELEGMATDMDEVMEDGGTVAEHIAVQALRTLAIRIKEFNG